MLHHTLQHILQHFSSCPFVLDAERKERWRTVRVQHHYGSLAVLRHVVCKLAVDAQNLMRHTLLDVL